MSSSFVLLFVIGLLSSQFIYAGSDQKSGSLPAEVQISSKNPLEHDVSTEVDGSILELGASKCTIKKGRCIFDGVTVGKHVASALIKVNVSDVTYKLGGTSGGSIVNIIKDRDGSLRLAPKNDPKIVFFLDRVNDLGAKPTSDPHGQQNGNNTESVKIDSALKVEIWVRVKDEGEKGSHDRQALDDELTGTVLSLGKAKCTVQGFTCTFPEVYAGEFKLVANVKDNSKGKASFNLAPDTRPFQIKMDPWTRRPKVKNWGKTIVVTIEKTIHR